MERSEPALVPEWLKNAGSVPGGGNSSHHPASSSYSDVPSAAHLARNRSSGRRNDLKAPCLSRSSSSSSWRNSSNGSVKHAYSNFNRHRDKDSNRDRDNSRYLDPWDRDSYEPLDSILHCREKDGLRRSQSMVNKKQVESFPSNDFKKDGILPGPNKTGTGMHKSVFVEDFPSLGCGERQGVFETSRASSPGLISAVQSLPIGNSVLIGGEGWSSALVEVPNFEGSSSTGPPSSPKTVGSVQTRTGDAGATHGLNMAEALAQVPSRARTPPQLSVQTQRLDELAVKQSRQLIPVTPSMPKVSVFGSSDKCKIKTAARSGEMSNAAFRSTHTIQSPSGGTNKSDSFKTSQGGKLYVLKPSWENGVNPSQTSNANGGSSSRPVPVPQPITVLPDRASKNPSLSMVPGVMLEKKHSLSQTKSRNEFFKLIKQKSSSNMPSDPVSAMEKHFVLNEAVGGRETPHDFVNSSEVANNGDAGKENNLCSESAWNPDDEEIAFLRSLGWEENHGEDEGLTKEEIDAFYNEYIKSKPTLMVCKGFLPTLTERHD